MFLFLKCVFRQLIWLNNGRFLPSCAWELFSLFENLILLLFFLDEDSESLTKVNNRVGTGSGHVPDDPKQ